MRFGLHLGRYELQYAEADRHEDAIMRAGAAAWQSVRGDSESTWDVSVQVDGFDR